MLSSETEVQKQSFKANTSLCIAAYGLAIHRLIIDELKKIDSENVSYLVLLINCEPHLQLISDCKQLKVVQISGEPSVVKRQEQYFSGGIFSSSLRTLVLDLLTIRLSPAIITSIIVVLNKQMVKKCSYLSMLLDTYQKGNPHANIRLFSDRPWKFDNLKIMERLAISKLNLLPRIHPEIKQDLDLAHSQFIKLEEHPIIFSPMNRILSKALIGLMKICIDYINYFASMAKVDTSFLTVTKALLRDTTAVMENHLGCRKYYELPHRIKMLFKDADSIRKLMRTLLDFDTVTFYVLLYNINLDAKEYSIFQYPDEETTELLNLITKVTRDMIYSIKKDEILDEEKEFEKYIYLETRNKEIKQNKLLHGYHFCLNLEYTQRLKKLGDIIQNLNAERKKEERGAKRMKLDNENGDGNITVKLGKSEEKADNIVIFCDDEKERAEIEDYLLSRFISPESKDIGISIKLKKYLIYRNDTLHCQIVLDEKNYPRFPPELIREVAIVQNKIINLMEEINNHYEGIYMGIQKKRERDEAAVGHELYDVPHEGVTEKEYFEVDIEGLYNGMRVVKGADVIVRVAHIPSDYYLVLEELKPKTIIMSHIKMAGVRAIENFCATQKYPIDVHQLFYKNTIEDYAFIRFAMKEKEGFSKLLKWKEERKHENTGLVRIEPVLSENPWTIVAVDIREFGSPLPTYLYRFGIKIVPLMLAVGDYVLSDDICIERKCVGTNDLFESIRQGRLLQQITRMLRFYKTPILLMEFDKTIGMEFYETGESIMKRLAILKANYPRVTFLWAQNAKESARIIMELKRDTCHLDLVKADKIGKTAGAEENATECVNGEEENTTNYSPLEVLNKIEGITPDAMQKILSKVRSLFELVALPLAKVQEIAGEMNGNTIYHFLHDKVRAKTNPNPNPDDLE